MIISMIIYLLKKNGSTAILMKELEAID